MIITLIISLKLKTMQVVKRKEREKGDIHSSHMLDQQGPSGPSLPGRLDLICTAVAVEEGSRKLRRHHLGRERGTHAFHTAERLAGHHSDAPSGRRAGGVHGARAAVGICKVPKAHVFKVPSVARLGGRDPAGCRVTWRALGDSGPPPSPVLTTRLGLCPPRASTPKA